MYRHLFGMSHTPSEGSLVDAAVNEYPPRLFMCARHAVGNADADAPMRMAVPVRLGLVRPRDGIEHCRLSTSLAVRTEGEQRLGLDSEVHVRVVRVWLATHRC